MTTQNETLKKTKTHHARQFIPPHPVRLCGFEVNPKVIIMHSKVTE